MKRVLMSAAAVASAAVVFLFPSLAQSIPALCRDCGRELPAAARFCPSCGASVDGEAAPPSAKSDSDATGKTPAPNDGAAAADASAPQPQDQTSQAPATITEEPAAEPSGGDSQSDPCTRCGGTGRESCKACKGFGRVLCPNSRFHDPKAARNKAAPEPDLAKRKPAPKKNAYKTIEEMQLRRADEAAVPNCPICGGPVEAPRASACPECEGKKTVPCRKCGGTGRAKGRRNG